jgi:TP901 family phage tail tape measure protein
MADRKTYEMLFALNARMNGGFSGTFSKAQQEFSRLGKEIQELHRLQGDVTSYQKQQTAVEATRAKLENLQKQHDLLQREIGETDGSTAGLERESVKLEQRIKDTEAALDRQGQKLEATGARLKEAGVDTGNLAQKDAELTSRIKELRAEQDKAADSAGTFGERTAQAFEAAGQAITAAGVAMAVKEITGAFIECVGVAGDFEEAMSTVEALSQANARDMAALAEEAKELGATTKFTAQEAGDAMGYMAMAGWGANDMLQGMDGVLQLAAASGEDLAMVSDIVTDSLSAFGLTAKDTAHFSDVLAAAATNSNTNVAIMGETFKMSASVAGALGYSIEDVALAMGLMANSGVKGSIAGTALRNTFNGLLEGVTLTGAAFGEYEYSAIKADGTMKDFGSTIDELRKYFDQMTEAERVNNAQAIAGQRGYNGLLAILNATDADYASLTNSINNCTGAAQRMADVKLDNMNGQLTLMNSAWDALKTTIGEQFIPEMRGLYEIGTDVFGVVDDFVKENPALVRAVVTFTGVMGGAALAITGVNAAMTVFKALNVAAMFTNPVFLAAGAVGALAAGVMALTTAADDGVPSVKELSAAAREMGEAMEEASAAYEETATQALATAEVAGVYIDKLEQIEAAEGENAAQNQEYQNTLALLLRTMPELSDSISQTTDQYGRSTYTLETDTQTLRANTEELKKNAQARAYQEYLNSLYDEYGAVLLEAAENSVKLTQEQTKLETAEKNWDAALVRMNELSEEAAENGTMLSAEYYELENAIFGYRDEMYEAERTIENLNKAMDKDAEAVAAAEAEFESAKEVVEQLTGVTEEQTTAEAEAAAQTQELQGVIEDITSQVAALTEAYNEAYGAALDSISGQYALWDEAAAVVETSAGSINSALESQITYWQDYNANLQSLTERSADIEGLSAVIASFADGSEDSVNAIAGLANASDEDLRAMVTNWQTLQEEQEAAAGSVAELKTDFTATMDELQNELAADIEAMDLGDEAAAAGQATIQGYINAANDMLPQVKTAYGNLAKAASSAMGYQSVYVPSSGTYVYQRGYASGTDNAAPGFALVGENGPELMFFNGGEKVMNAAETSAIQEQLAADARMMSLAPQMAAVMNTRQNVEAVSAKASGGGAPVQISVPVSIQVSGNAGPDTLEALREYGEELTETVTERVMDALEEAQIDAVRSAYR